MAVASLAGTLYSAVPGLRIIPNYLPPKDLTNMREGGQCLNEAMRKEPKKTMCVPFLLPLYSGGAGLVMSRKVQCTAFPEDGKLTADFIQRFSEDGHRILAFKGHKNIPSFIKATLIAHAQLLPEAVAVGGNELSNWNCLANSYVDSGSPLERIRDFEFHQDGAFTGRISLIYSLGATAILKMRKYLDKRVMDFEIPSNTLVVLSRGAHYDFEHRFVTINSQNAHFSKNFEEVVRRMSIVLGVHGKV